MITENTKVEDLRKHKDLKPCFLILFIIRWEMAPGILKKMLHV